MFFFKNADNEAQLNYIAENGMTVEQAINSFAVRHSAGAADALLDFDYGFLTEYVGYHSHP